MIETFLACTRYRVPSPGIIYDFGCREGKESIAFANAYPEAQIYAFECNPRCLVEARQRLAEYPNITLVEGAVSDRHNQTVEFYAANVLPGWDQAVADTIGTSSLLRPTQINPYIKTELCTKITVRSLRIDQWAIAGPGRWPPDLLWMDIQGSELAAMKGMGVLLRLTKGIHLEVAYQQNYVGAAMFPEVRAFLEEQGFACVLNWPGFGYEGDAIFINQYDAVFS